MTLVNVFLGRYEGGWTEAGDLASEVANGRAEALLELGGIYTNEMAVAVIDEAVAGTAGERVSSVVEIEPADDTEQPYKAFDTFDRVNLLQPDGTVALSKVQAISATADRNAHPLWTLDCHNRILSGARDTETWLRRSRPGLIPGLTETSNPARPASIIESGDVIAKRWTASKAGALSSGELESVAEKFSTPAHVCLFQATITTAASSGTTTVLLKRSGTTIATVNIAAGTNEGWVGIAASAGYVAPTDTLQVVLSVVGTGAAGLAASARYI